jgi:pullulanase
MHSGQEMLRTKRGNSNSYNQPDAVNMINWDLKRTNMDIFEYYKGLIALRKAHPMFKMATRQDVKANLKFFDQDLGIGVPGRCVAYRLTRGNSGDSWNEVLVMFNANPNAVTFTIPEGDWTVVVNGDQAGTEPVTIGESSVSGDKVEVAGVSAKVLYR